MGGAVFRIQQLGIEDPLQHAPLHLKGCGAVHVQRGEVRYERAGEVDVEHGLEGGGEEVKLTPRAVLHHATHEHTLLPDAPCSEPERHFLQRLPGDQLLHTRQG